MPLPPEKVTRSNPIWVYFHKLEWGGRCGGVVKTGDAMAVGHANPVLAADLPAFRGVEEMRHHRAIVERGLVFPQGLDFDEADTAIGERVVVVVAVGLLDDDFGLEPGHVVGMLRTADLFPMVTQPPCRRKSRVGQLDPRAVACQPPSSRGGFAQAAGSAKTTTTSSGVAKIHHAAARIPHMIDSTRALTRCGPGTPRRHPVGCPQLQKAAGESSPACTCERW